MGSILTFEQPMWLVAAAAGVVPVLLAVRAGRRGRAVSAAGVVAQSLVIVLAALALARPVAPWGPVARRPYLVLTDVSDSVRDQAGRGLQAPAGLPREDFAFADDVAAPGREVAKDRTRLAPALRLALARADEIAGVIVRSDGQFEDSDWPTLAQALAAAGRRIYVIPMETPPSDARVAELTGERQGDGTVQLRVTADANAPVRRDLTVWRDDRRDSPLWRQELRLLGQPATIRLSDTPPADRAAVYRAALGGPDALGENDTASAVVLPQRRRLAGVGEPPAYLQALAAGAGLTMETLAPPSAPPTPGGWEEYAAVVLSDAGGMLLAAPARAALAEYVRGGGGLVLIGAGPHDTPGDRADPLNQVAALAADAYQRRPLQLVVVLDASGSMALPAAEAEGPARIKFDLAREAVLSLRRHLTEADALEVIAFSNSPQRIHDSGEGAIDFARLGEALAPVRPGGPTVVAPALELATASPAAEGRQGLVLVVSDLRTQPFDAAAMAERFRRQGFAAAVAATPTAGDSSAPQSSLEQFAAALDAPLVPGVDLKDLAEVFSRFLRQARGEAVRRGEFPAAFPRSPFGLAAAGVPALPAYVLSAPQAGAEVLAETGRDPVLAQRRVGLGRSVTLAVPIADAGLETWRQSPQVRGLLAAAIRWVLRAAGDGRFTGTIRREGPEVEIALAAEDAAGAMNLLKLTAAIQPLAGASAPEEVPLEQVAPGRYVARAAVDGVVSAAVRDDRGVVVWSGGLAGGYGREYAAIGANWPALRRLADAGGGRVLTGGDGEGLLAAWRQGAYVPLWPYLLAAALALMLGEWLAASAVRAADRPADRTSRPPS